MLYDRKIKYLDYYENGQRVKGGGFLKMEVRDGRLRIDLVVTGLHPTDIFERDIVVCGEKLEKAMGQIAIHAGKGEFRHICQDLDSIGGTGIAYDEMKGIRIPLGAGREISCTWPVRKEGKTQERDELTKSKTDREITASEFSVSTINKEARSAISKAMGKEAVTFMGKESVNAAGREAAGREAASLKSADGPIMANEEERKNVGVAWEKDVSGDRGAGMRNILIHGEANRETNVSGETKRGRNMSGEAEWVRNVSGEAERSRNVSGEAERGRNVSGEAERSRNVVGEAERVRNVSGETKRSRNMSGEAERSRNVVGEAERVRNVSGETKRSRNMHGEIEVLRGNGRQEANAARDGRRKAQEAAYIQINGGNIGTEREKGMGARRNEVNNPQRGTAERPVRLLEDKWQQLYAIYPHIRPFEDEREYISIGPSDFVLFPSESYKMVNNSFLLHGYYNYKHIILAKVEKRGEFFYYIGVPGTYYEKEKQVAIMFGFESFECAEEPAQAGDFGYYMMRTQL